MNPEPLVHLLRSTPAALRMLLAHVAPDHARRRGPGGAWSIVEIVHHLADEEIEDFGLRLRLMIEDPAAAWPGIDPEGAVRERDAINADLAEQLDRFAAARAESVAWLEALTASGGPDWSRTYEHPSLGPIAAGDLLAAWADHDLLHLRQIARRLHEIVQAEAAPFGTDYAGVIGQ
ncbi:MAG: DinB family protein [Phycisphaerales bacterium JB037]